MPFYSYNRPGAKISEGVRKSFWLQGMMCGLDRVMPKSGLPLRREFDTDHEARSNASNVCAESSTI
jgi:hypothetical protein